MRKTHGRHVHVCAGWVDGGGGEGDRKEGEGEGTSTLSLFPLFL